MAKVVKHELLCCFFACPYFGFQHLILYVRTHEALLVTCVACCFVVQADTIAMTLHRVITVQVARAEQRVRQQLESVRDAGSIGLHSQ